MRRGFALTLGALLVGCAAGLAVAQDGGSTTIAVTPTRVEFVGADGLAATREVRVSISGGRTGTVTLSMLDAVVGADGGRRNAPYGTSATSLQGALRVEPSTFDYTPDGTTQLFVARLTVDAAAVRVPRIGSLVAVLGPRGEPSATVVQQAGVAVEVLAAPDAAGLADLPPDALDVRIGELEVGDGNPYTPVGALLPDLPFVVGRGPLEVSTAVRNAGEVLLDTQVVYTFSRVSLFASLPIERLQPRPLLTLRQPPVYLLPGQRVADSTSTRPDTARFDATPFIGLFRVTAQATGTIAGTSVVSQVRTRTVLAFPVAESLVVAVGALVYRRVRSRNRRRARMAAIAASPARPATPPRPAPVRKEGLGEWWARRGRETAERMGEFPRDREDAPR